MEPQGPCTPGLLGAMEEALPRNCLRQEARFLLLQTSSGFADRSQQAPRRISIGCSKRFGPMERYALASKFRGCISGRSSLPRGCSSARVYSDRFGILRFGFSSMGGSHIGGPRSQGMRCSGYLADRCDRSSWLTLGGDRPTGRLGLDADSNGCSVRALSGSCTL